MATIIQGLLAKSLRAGIPVLFLAVFFQVVAKLLDKQITGIIHHDDVIVQSLSFLCVGSVIGTVVMWAIAYTPKLGKMLDDHYPGQPVFPSGSARRVVIGAGILGAVSTGFYLAALIQLDTATVNAFSCLSLALIVFYTIFAMKVKDNKAWSFLPKGQLEMPPLKSLPIPILCNVAGVFLISWQGNTNFLELGIFVILILSVVFLSAREIVEKYGVDKTTENSLDAVTFRTWYFTIFAAFATLAAVLYTGYVYHSLLPIWETFAVGFNQGVFYWLFLLMLAGNLGLVLRLSLKGWKPVSEVYVLNEGLILPGIFIAFVGFGVAGNASLGVIPTDPLVIGVRIIAIILLIISIFKMPIKEKD